MSKQIFIWMLICLNGTDYVYAQWTEKDSVWLQNVLSGKEKLQLNPEAMKSIESGSLLNTEKPASNMIIAPAQSPASSVLKDFSEYIRKENANINPNRKMALKDLPPAVFMRYGLDKPMPKQKFGAFNVSPDIRANARRPSGISFDDLLKSVFMPNERAKRKNASRWQTNKYYNNYP